MFSISYIGTVAGTPTEPQAPMGKEFLAVPSRFRVRFPPMRLITKGGSAGSAISVAVETWEGDLAGARRRLQNATSRHGIAVRLRRPPPISIHSSPPGCLTPKHHVPRAI